MSRKDKKVFAIIVSILIILIVGGYLLVSFLQDTKDNNVENTANRVNNPTDNVSNIIEDVRIDDSTPGGIPSQKVQPAEETMITENSIPSNKNVNEKID